MFPASTREGGQCFAYPDVCKTPAPPAPFVPVPYPNIAMPNRAEGGSCANKVKVRGQPALVQGTTLTMSSGDEAGTAGGGMVSARFKGAAKYKQGSSKVKFEGRAAAHLGVTVGQNDASNCNMPVGHQVMPSQTAVLVAA